MWFLLLACTGSEDLSPPEEPFRGNALLSLEGSHAGTDEVSLDWVGWSRFLEDDVLTVTASDDAGVWDLVVVLDGEGEAGEQTPLKVFLKKGTQVFLDAGATCTADLVGDSPWELDLECLDLATEEGSPNHEDRLFTLTASLSGETFTQDEYRANRFTIEGWFAGPQLFDSPHVEEPIDFRDSERAVVLPWRDDATWVLWEDGEDDSLDDVLLRFSPAEGEWLVERWVRWGLDPLIGAQLDVVAETEITMGVQGREDDVTGSAFSLTLWESLQEGDNSLVVVVK